MRKTKHQKLKIIAINVVIITLVLAGVEFVLRLGGNYPGLINNYITPVDSLIVHPEYETDSVGLFKLSPEGRNSINQKVKLKKGELKLMEVWKNVYRKEIAQLIPDLHFLANDYSPEEVEQFCKENDIDKETTEELVKAYRESEFRNFVRKLWQKKKYDQVDSAYLYYVQHPINESGYRSIPFRKYKTNKPRVLLLGASYTWGRSAKPLFCSFPDILSARGYVVYNTGIVCADPAQYAVAAEKFVPILKPDFVFTIYYMGHDNMYVEREPKQGQPPIHFTNAGNLKSNILGYYMTPQETYDYILADASIPNTKNSIFNRLCSKTVLTTRLWTVLNKLNLVSNENPELDNFLNREVPEIHGFPISDMYIDRITKVCDSLGIPSFLILIPDLITKMDDYSSINYYKRIFKNNKYYYPQGITVGDFAGHGDDHLNNLGHKKYADFIQHLIDSSLAVTGK